MDAEWGQARDSNLPHRCFENAVRSFSKVELHKRGVLSAELKALLHLNFSRSRALKVVVGNEIGKAHV